MPGELDQLIGQRVGELRRAQNIDVATAASACGISSEDYELSELGQKRFSAISLFKLARRLDVEISTFFDGIHWT